MAKRDLVDGKNTKVDCFKINDEESKNEDSAATSRSIITLSTETLTYDAVLNIKVIW